VAIAAKPDHSRVSETGANKRSAYMEWAKTSAAARFNLATSGLTNVAIRELPISAEPVEITGPGGYGYEPLQQRLARHTDAPVECVVAATGASMANHLAIAVALDPDDEVLIEQPAYGLFVDVANYLHARVTRFQRQLATDFAIDSAEIEALLTPKTRLLVVSNLHNPSGALIPEHTLRTIGELARARGVFVLVDEAYREMLFERPAPSAFSVGQKLGAESNPFIVTNSLTKTYGVSGLRCGWILARPDLARRMWRLNDLFGVNAAHPAEQLSVRALDSLESLRARSHAILSANRALLNDFLDSRNDLECFRPPGGTVVFPRLRRGDAELFVERLRDKYETSVVPGKFFDMPEHFRIGVGADTTTVRGGLERLAAALREDTGA
jgi:aspartate/methionine/tyrosine aminotransferase